MDDAEEKMVTDNTPGDGPVLRLFEVKVRDGHAEKLLRKFSTTSADVVRNEPGNCGYFFGRGMLTDAGRLVFASLSGKTSWAQCRHSSFVCNLSKWIGLIHKLRKLIRSEERIDY